MKIYKRRQCKSEERWWWWLMVKALMISGKIALSADIIPSMLVMELRNFISETHQNCFHQSHLESQSKIIFKFITNQTCLTKLQEISSHTRQSCFHKSQSTNIFEIHHQPNCHNVRSDLFIHERWFILELRVISNHSGQVILSLEYHHTTMLFGSISDIKLILKIRKHIHSSIERSEEEPTPLSSIFFLNLAELKYQLKYDQSNQV